MSEATEFLIHDLALAAFLRVKGIEMVKAEQAKPDGRFCFTFESDRETIDKLSIEFINSEIRKYDDEIRSIKKILYSKKK